MKGGFSYKGIDIADIGLSYEPDLDDTFVYRPTTATLHEEVFEGHDGGYYYGSTKQPKEFTLRCIFENSNINRGVMSNVYALFRRGSNGPLVFQRRPWCYYNVVITDVQESFTNYMNGFVTISAKAYYPFARSDVFYVGVTDKNYVDLMRNTAIVDTAAMVPSANIDCTTPITQEKEIILLNPGTERAACGIEIAGDSISGVRITNRTTEEQCKYVALSRAATTNQNKFVYTDPINGKTVLKSTISGVEPTINFLYHDYGFLSLQPAFPAIRNLYATPTLGSNKVNVKKNVFDKRHSSDDEMNGFYVGRFIYISGLWYEIARIVDSNTLELTKPVSVVARTNRTERTMIVTMNKILISPIANDTSLTRLNFIYKPTYA